VQQGTESAAQQDIKSTAQHARARAFRAAQRRAPQPPHQAFNQTPQHLVSACCGQPLIPTAQLSPAARRLANSPPPLPLYPGIEGRPLCRPAVRRGGALQQGQELLGESGRGGGGEVPGARGPAAQRPSGAARRAPPDRGPEGLQRCSPERRRAECAGQLVLRADVRSSGGRVRASKQVLLAQYQLRARKHPSIQ
jgi:hypothetical protein